MGMYIAVFALYLVYSILAMEFLVCIPAILDRAIHTGKKVYMIGMVGSSVIISVMSFIVPMAIPMHLGCDFWYGAVMYLCQVCASMLVCRIWGIHRGYTPEVE